MIKKYEVASPDSCWNRADDSEHVFVLLGRDPAAPAAIRTWCKERIRLKKNQPLDPEIRGAHISADCMEFDHHHIVKRLRDKDFYKKIEDL